MNICKFSDVVQFRQHVEPFLLQHEAENHLILGILGDILSGDYAEAYMVCVETKDDIALVALRTPPHNLLLSTTSNLDSIAFIVADLHQEYMMLSGISTLSDIAQSFAEQWQLATGQTYTQNGSGNLSARVC